jgi:hypothetical protein
MNKEEIYKRIMVCEKKERDFLEAGNTRTANRYHNEIQKWEKLLNQLNPKMEKELNEYRRGYYKQKEVIDKAINELSILKNMMYKPETREENFEIQKKLSSLIKRLNSKEVSE